MKKIFLLGVLFLSISCTVSKKPTFLRFGDIKLVSISTDSVTVKATAFFKNENDIGGKISTDNIQVFVAEKPVANVKSKEFEVPANKEFEVPLNVALPYNKVFEKGLLGGLLNSVIGSKGIEVRFKGDINYKVLGFTSSYPIDKVEKLELN